MAVISEIQKRYSRFISNPISYSSALHNRSEWEWERFHFHNPKPLIFFGCACGALLAAASGDWITVPYSGRSHFVLFNKFIKKFIPDNADFHGVTLHPRHPDYVNARRIYEDIIHQASLIERDMGEESSEDCQIIVPVSNNFIIASKGFRKIYVTTAILRYYKRQEAMLATILGAEVGLSLAKHKGELVSKVIRLVSSIGISLYLFCKSSYIQSKIPFLEELMRHRFLSSFGFVASVALLSYLPTMKYMREMVMEGDYIGLMLAASAGYDPLMGGLFPIYRRNLYQRKLPDCFYPTPSNAKRSNRLSQPRVINEANLRYTRGNNGSAPAPARLPLTNGEVLNRLASQVSDLVPINGC